jgi:hypothetical protein
MGVGAGRVELPLHSEFYQNGKRLHVDVSAEGKIRAVVYFTPETVTMDEAIAILRKRVTVVKDERENPSGE